MGLSLFFAFRRVRTMPTPYRPRLSIDLTDEQREALDRILGQHGLQRAVFSVIVDDLINSVDKHGTRVISALLARAIKLEDIARGNEDEH